MNLRETTYTSLRASLASVLDRVANDREVIIIRRKGDQKVALVPADELAGLMETAHLLDRRKMPSGCSLPYSGRRAAKAGQSPWRSFAGRWVLAQIVEQDAVFHPEFRQDLRYWVSTDRKAALRGFELIEVVLRDPLYRYWETRAA